MAPTFSSVNAPSIIRPLAELRREDIAIAGGKGANLGELIHAGFRVPPGFVVSTAAYDHFVAIHRLDRIIERELREQSGGGANIRAAFESSDVPAFIAQEIRAAYHTLGGGAVAVRSSATAEDLPQAAFAGQQDTYLDITGTAALLDAIRRCWASLWTERAIQYREHQGIDQATVKLAVVVQKMVPAQIAGVMFTANPVSGARDEIVIDASPGLGEAVVSGLVTPDHAILKDQHSGWKVSNRRQGRAEVVIHPRGNDGAPSTPAARPVGTSLADHELFDLARLGRAIERDFGSPQDVEWAWAAGEFSILQARPITALPSPPPRPGKMTRMLSAVFAEMFPVRPYPLDQTTWVPAISDAATTPLFSLLGFSAPSIDQFFSEENGVVSGYLGKISVRPTPGILLAPVRLLWYALRYDPANWARDPQQNAARESARRLEAIDPQKASLIELLEIVDQATELPLPLAGEIRRRYFPATLLSAALLRILLALCGQGERFGALLSGSGSVTMEANQMLERLAGRVRANPTLANIFATTPNEAIWQALTTVPPGLSFLSRLRGFLDRYGYREVVLSTLTQPTWKDSPEVVLGIIKGLVHTSSSQPASQPAWETARDAVLSRPLMRLKPFRWAFLTSLTTARFLWQIRENTHYEATRVLPVLRRTLLEVGARLVPIGLLTVREDVFHLKWDELKDLAARWPPPAESIAATRGLVEWRKQRRLELEGIPVIDPRWYATPEQDDLNEIDLLLRGTPGSPGVAEGPVRVVLDASQFNHLRAGEVLVAPYTNPAWTPLFQRAAAIIVDGGAAGSHAAIVAREYGIPAVMGVVTGTSQLEDGQIVRVDGSRGLVFRGHP